MAKQKRMSEAMADRFRDIHSTDTVQYVLGLSELPTEQEFILEHKKTCKHKHRSGGSCAKKLYKFLKEVGLP